MNPLTKTGLTALLVGFFYIQFSLTLFGGFLWPFSSHRLFSQLPTQRKEIVQAILTDANGNQTIHHPGRVIPIEYSRCSGLIRKMAKESSLEQKNLFCAYLIKRLNYNPWWAFDEMFSSPIRTVPFTKIRFETHVIEFDYSSKNERYKRLEQKILLP